MQQTLTLNPHTTHHGHSKKQPAIAPPAMAGIGGGGGGGGGSSGSSSDVGLGQYETRAANLLQRLGQLAEHLRQVQASPQLVHPDWCARACCVG